MNLSSKLNTFLLAAIFVAACPAEYAAVGDSAVTVSFNLTHPGPVFSTDFSGLSFEMSQLLPSPNGLHYFRPENLPLVNLFHTLGIKSLRVGGNTADRSANQLPGDADLDSFFAFAKAANVKVIYCLRLHDGDPQADARTAKYIMARYANEMDCFSIGQEPSAYPKPYSYSNYRSDWRKFAGTIIAAVPDVKFCGPSVHNNGAWARNFMADFGRSHHVVLITEHLYPGGSGNKVVSPEIGIDRMLESAAATNSFVNVYQRLYESFVPMADSNQLPYRLEEANNYFNGGAKDVSNTFASALWGLDFMFWWAEHGAQGVNFHTGDRVSADYQLRAAKYTAFYSTANGYLARPLAYGIKAFNLSSHGHAVPVELSPSHFNLTAYCVLGPDHNVCVTLINKEHDAAAQTLTATIRPNGGRFRSAQVMYLAAPDHNVADTSGETLGNAEIQTDGIWNGQWTPIGSSEKDGDNFTIHVPPATATIVKLLPD